MSSRCKSGKVRSQRFLLVCSVLWICHQQGYAQNLGGSGFQLDAYDVKGRVFTSMPNEEEANPMLNKNWGKGRVQFSNKSWVKEMDLQFNLALNELYFRKNDLVYTFADSIREFFLIYAEDKSSNAVHFRCGYPAQGKSTPLTFYQVLADGNRLHLLSYRTKNLQVVNNYGEGTKRIYKEVQQLFWYDPVTHQLVKAARDLESLKQYFPALAKDLERLLSGKKTRIRSDGEMVEFIKQLNQL